MQARRRWRAWLASLTVTVLAVAPLLALFHQASTRHAICEHGALIESDDASAYAARTTGTDTDVSDSDDAHSSSSRVLRSDSAPEAHAHVHCAVGTLARAGVGVISPTSFLVSSLSIVAPEARPIAVPRAHPILANAPKTSPPAFTTNISA